MVRRRDSQRSRAVAVLGLAFGQRAPYLDRQDGRRAEFDPVRRQRDELDAARLTLSDHFARRHISPSSTVERSATRAGSEGVPRSAILVPTLVPADALLPVSPEPE